MLKSGIAIWVPVNNIELVERYESEGWKIVSRWTHRAGFYDSYLMVKETDEVSRIPEQEISAIRTPRI